MRHPLLCALALAVAACGGSTDTDVAVGVGGNGGTVVVVVTDGPVDPESFSHIFVTFTGITLIGAGGQVEIFDGRETVDLRDLEDTATLLGVGREVPEATYEKIRLDVEEIELVSAADGSSSFPKLPPKIDLLPQGGFMVEPDETVLVQIDMDAGKSIHIVETGNGGLRFRPVVFVDILEDVGDSRLVLLQGEVTGIGPATFMLCDTHSAPLRTGGGDDDCVPVRFQSDTSYFDANGDPIELADLDTGDAASVLGRFEVHGDELFFDAEVVLLGEEVVALDGLVATEPSFGGFVLDLDPGQGVVTDDGLLSVDFQSGTRLFTREGEELDPEELEIGDPVHVLGVLELSSADDDVLKAAAVMVDVDADDEATQIEGEITSAIPGSTRHSLDVPGRGNTCLDVSDADLFLVTSRAGSAEVEAIDALHVGDAVSAFGHFENELGFGVCFHADTAIVLDER